LLDELCKLVVSTGKAIVSRRNIDSGSGVWKGDQLKTISDDFAHDMLASNLPKILSVPVISEEDYFSQVTNRPKRYWLIDPIDGTRSLVDGFSGWVSQVALIENNEPVMAAITAPDLDLLFTAEKGNGSFCNGKKISVNQSVSSRLLFIDNYPEPRGVALDIMKKLSCTGYIESGSIALKICRIADGTADLFVKDVPIRDWDVAAPMLVLNEAGGVLKTYTGQEFQFLGGFEKNGLIVSRDDLLNKKCLSFL
jgi:3'(2'), 5'-bisphosphate nucleotidase